MELRHVLLRKPKAWLATLALAALPALTGCQVDVAGQTLPSPYWLYDDVQYFAPGTEFKLSREAAAMQAAAAEGGAVGGAPGAGAPPGPMNVSPAGP